jgi:hypothetical protein
MDIKTFAETCRLKLRHLTSSRHPGPGPDRPYIPGAHGWITGAQGGLLKALLGAA